MEAAFMLFVARRHKPSRARSVARLVSGMFFGLLCCPLVHGQSASIALVQHVNRDAGTTTSSSLAFPANNAAGDWIAVVVRSGRSSQVITVGDSRGNTYQQAVQTNVTVDAPLGDTLAIFYAENIQAGANTITVSHSLTNATLRFAILEYSGIALAGSMDGAAAAQGTNAAPSSGSTTPTASGDLLLGAIMTADARTFTGGGGFVIGDRVPVAPGTKLIVEDRIQPAAGSASAGATLNAGNPWGAVVAAFRAAPTKPLPDLRLTKTHGGAFIRGQTGATYALTVSNIGSASSVGTVTVTDALPAGLTATGVSGSGWNCTLAPLSCTRSDGLAAASSYAPIALTVSVAGDAPASVTNTASVSGGGEVNAGNDAASDLTPIGGGASDTQPPTAPGSLTATAAGGSQVNLNWTASTDNIGVASYLVEQCQGAGCTSFIEIAQVDAGSAGAGPLSASANPNYFKDASGTPLILNGSHAWNNLQDWGSNGSLQTLDFNAYVSFLVAHGHNFTLLWYVELPKFCNLPTTAASAPEFTVGPHPWPRTGPGSATDGAPKFDLTRFNQAYFDRLRARAQALNAAGIYVGVYTFTAEWIYRYRCSTDGYPFTGANNINGVDDGGGTGSFTMSSPNAITAIQDAYVEKVIDTLNDLPNVLWIVSEEAPPNSTWWNDHQISHIRSYESAKPARHPIGYAVPADLGDTVLFNSNADWVAGASSIAPTTSCGSGTPTCKVNVNDSDHSYFGMWNSSAQANRNFAWQNFTNGNQVVFMDPYVVDYPREGRNLCPSPVNGICASPDTRWDDFRDNLGYILRYSRKLNLANVTPRSSLSSTSRCLAQTPSVGAEYLIYAPDGGSFTVNLSAMSSSRSLKVEWLNPSTGATTVASPIPAGSSSQSFTPPFSGDAVLYLVDAAGHAGPVPLPTSYNVTGLPSGAYRYRVRAADAAGNLSPYSNVASATVQGPDTEPPTAPGGLTATTPGTGQISLSWAASTDNVGVTAYLVERCQGVGCTAFTQVAAPAGTTFGDTGLAASTSYTYRVRARDAANNPGPYSSTATATTLPATTAISLGQHASKDAGSAASSSLAFATNNTAGNWIAVAIRSWPSSQALTVTDTRGNTYRRAIQLNETVDGMALAIFYAENIAGGSNAVTVSRPLAGGTLRFAILEYAGVAIASSLDGTAAGQGTSTTPISGIVTPTSSGDLVMGVLSTADERTFTAGSGYVIEERVPAAASTKLVVEDRTQTTAGPLSAGAALSASDNWGAVVAAFRAKAPGLPAGITVDTTSPGTTPARGTSKVAVAGGGELSTANDSAANRRGGSGVFHDETLISGLKRPAAIKFLPNGDMLVLERGGRIWRVPAGTGRTAATPFLSLTNIGTNGQQGLMDLALDPEFATNHRYYVLYTLGIPNRDRVSRFTATADNSGTVSGSELVRHQDSQDADAEHHGGSLYFANDGKLSITTGERSNGAYYDRQSGRLFVGGFIYRGSQYPAQYVGSYFFADDPPNRIRRLTFGANGSVNGVFDFFGPPSGGLDGSYGDVVYLTEGPDGALYYVDSGYSDVTPTTGVGRIRRIRYISNDLPPTSVVSASVTEGPAPLAIDFSSGGSADPEGVPLTYRWDFGDGSTSVEPNPAHTYAGRGAYAVRLTVSDGNVSTVSDPLAITVGKRPVVTILSPVNGTAFRVGDVITLAGDGIDWEDGALPDSAFTWSIDFLRAGHVYPGLLNVGTRSGTLRIPATGHRLSGDARYRITLTVTDSDGMKASQSVILYPDRAAIP
jgi:uncharacterized repeat protein (TIGR01451 family)